MRILLKLSGESLGNHLFDEALSKKVSNSIYKAQDENEIGIVIGAGNVLRGVEKNDFDRVNADHIGMLATYINGIYLHEMLKKIGCKSKLLGLYPYGTVIEKYSRDKALKFFSEKYIVIFLGGTGLPFFTTDTAAANYALQIKADILLKATKVDGVYDKDPIKEKSAKKYQTISYDDILQKQLGVIDAAAIILSRDNRLPICIFDLFQENFIIKAISKKIGTLIGESYEHRS